MSWHTFENGKCIYCECSSRSYRSLCLSASESKAKISQLQEEVAGITKGRDIWREWHNEKAIKVVKLEATISNLQERVEALDAKLERLHANSGLIGSKSGLESVAVDPDVWSEIFPEDAVIPTDREPG